MFSTRLLTWALLSSATYVSATVNLYGPQGPAADYIQCTNPDASDKLLANLLELENSEQATRNNNSFTYDVDLPCGNDYATAVATQCAGLEGYANCVQVNSDPSSKKSRRLAITKRNAHFCKDYSTECDSTVPSDDDGECPDGYDIQTIEVIGTSSGTVCSKPCTDEQKTDCLENTCDFRRQQCEMNPKWIRVCSDALIKCRQSGPVKTDQSICKSAYLPTGSGQNDNSDCANRVFWSDGACNVNNTAFDACYTANDAWRDLIETGVANSDFQTE